MSINRFIFLFCFVSFQQNPDDDQCVRLHLHIRRLARVELGLLAVMQGCVDIADSNVMVERGHIVPTSPTM